MVVLKTLIFTQLIFCLVIPFVRTQQYVYRFGGIHPTQTRVVDQNSNPGAPEFFFNGTNDPVKIPHGVFFNRGQYLNQSELFPYHSGSASFEIWYRLVLLNKFLII